jgi:uncharacterized protein YdaU (DUF1376 family)
MNDQEVGFYHRCLNKSWVNVGIPADMDALAKLMGRTRTYIDRVWKAVGPCWYQDGDRLFNRTQEEERLHAVTRSENATKSVRSRYERSAKEPPRGRARADSDSDSVSEVLVISSSKTAEDKFPVWFNGFRGRKADPDGACRQWISRITAETLDVAFACRDRYNASEEVSRGVLMEAKNFIEQQANGGWRGEWPVVGSVVPKPTFTERSAHRGIQAMDLIEAARRGIRA